MILRPSSHQLSTSLVVRVLTALGAGFIIFLSACEILQTSAADLPFPKVLPTQAERHLTPLQREVEDQRRSLSSSSVEERRDAVMRLGAMGRPESSRAASAALDDRAAIVRAGAARAIIFLGPTDAAALLSPLLLRDRDEFVRREAAYALGLARSRAAVTSLVTALESDKQPSVRGAAAVALGQIGDPLAVIPLARKLSQRIPATGFFSRILRRRKEEDEFVRRSAAISLGQIGSREGVPALIEALSNERAGDDVRREAARALGLIGDPAAIPALRSVLDARDPYLSRLAYDALRKLEPPSATRPT